MVYCANKQPPSLVGDGSSTIRDLLAVHNAALRSHGLSSAAIAAGSDDCLGTVLPKGEQWEIPGRMNFSAGGTMVFESPRAGSAALARRAAAALGLRVAAVDLFTDIERRCGRGAGDRGELEPVDPAVGGQRQGRPDPENLASHLFRDGPALVFGLPKTGDGVCLARLAELLDALSVDRARLQRTAVVVTGSNGKGSTAAFCAGIGRAYGLRSGLFTSPHLYRFNERFQVDGDPIDDATLARLVARIEAAIAELSRRDQEKFGAFEALFALACLYFQETECDFAVFEAGIGGRYDPVRLIGAQLTCVTSVDYEHVELLGDSWN